MNRGGFPFGSPVTPLAGTDGPPPFAAAWRALASKARIRPRRPARAAFETA